MRPSEGSCQGHRSEVGGQWAQPVGQADRQRRGCSLAFINMGGAVVGRLAGTLGLPLRAEAQALTCVRWRARQQVRRPGSLFKRSRLAYKRCERTGGGGQRKLKGQGRGGCVRQRFPAKCSCQGASGLPVRWRSAKWRGVRARAGRMLRLKETQRWSKSFAAEARAVASGGSVPAVVPKGR